jgi:WD40 repeat protein
LPAKSQSLRLLSDEAETICLPSGLKFALVTSAVCPTKVCRPFVGHTAEVSSVNFSPDGKQIVSASSDKSLKLWDLAGNCLQTFVNLYLKPQSYAQQKFADNCLLLQTFVGHTAEVSSVNFSPDGKQIVSASSDKSLKLWDLAGNCLQT